MKRYQLAGIVIAIVALDQLTKTAVRNLIPFGSSVKVAGFIHLSHVSNTGAAFSIFTGWNPVLLIIGLAAISFISYHLWKGFEHPIALSIILGGVIGNVIDRIAHGYVTDFIDLQFWPIFNAADSAISIGAVILAYLLYREENREEKKHKKKHRDK